MIAMTVEMLLCVGIMVWLLDRKNGEKFTSNFVMKLILFGMIPVIIPIMLEKYDYIAQNTSPLLHGFLRALTFAVIEETLIFIAFRLAVARSHEVLTIHDAVIASSLVTMGFVILDDVLYTVTGGQLIHAALLMHLVFAVITGYFFAKGRAENKKLFHIFSLLIPVVLHTFFDTWLYAMRFAGENAGTVYKVLAIVDFVILAVCIVLSFVFIVKLGKVRDANSVAGNTNRILNNPAYASPEGLDNYIRVTSPPVWAALIGMLMIVIGIFSWASLGRIDVKLEAGSVAKDGKLTCYIPTEYTEYLSKTSTVTVADTTVYYSGEKLRGVQSTGSEADLLREYNIDPETVMAVELDCPVTDGIYRAVVTVETVSPMELILG